MKEKRVSVRIRETDRNFLKEKFKCSISEAVHKLIWGTKEDLKDVAEALLSDWMQETDEKLQEKFDKYLLNLETRT